MLQNNSLTRKPGFNTTAGYTLLEQIIIVVIMGILSAIAAPAWLHFTNIQRLNHAQDQVYWEMQEANSNAKRDKLTWQVSFRKNSEDVFQFAIHQADASQFIPASVLNNPSLWENFDPNVVIDESQNDRGKYETSLVKDGSSAYWRVQFNYWGCPVRTPDDECGQTSIQALGRLTLRSKNGGEARRCVIVSTLLGNLRRGYEHDQPDGSDKYCY
jgi:type II secretory pathway pseudopilin PulG